MHLPPLAIAAVLAASVTAGAADVSPFRLSAEDPRVAVHAGTFHNVRPFVADDPIDAFAGELPTKPFLAKELAAFVDGYVQRIEAHHASDAPAGMIDWLAAHPQLRRDFWLALSPRYDDAKGALGVLDQLRAHDERRTLQFSQLAIAFAVVWDTPDAVQTSRWTGIWGIDDAQFPPLPTLCACFDYFTLKPAGPLAFKLADLPWPVLVHLVDFDVTSEEAGWGAKACAPFRADVGSSYEKVPYDYTKKDRGGASALGSRPYTLQNLLQYGGVCGDRAHFTTRLAKTFGIPAMICTGEGRYGGAGHAWAGNLVARNGKPALDFSGRFDYDFYYTGEVFDPQTRTCVLDRTVAMVDDGLAQSAAKYSESMVLARSAAKLAPTEPAAAVLLARQAIDRSVFNPQAWNVLADAAAKGAIEAKESAKLANRMLGELAGHPDLTLACLGRFMDSLPKTQVDARMAIYEQALKLYAQRPDLQIRLRMDQCAELRAAGREPKALEVALVTVVANAKEGGLVLPLLTQVVETAKVYNKTNPRFQLDVVKQQIALAAKTFPQKRGTEVSQSWLDFQKISDSL